MANDSKVLEISRVFDGWPIEKSTIPLEFATTSIP